MPKKKTVAVVGLGAMGRRMAEILVKTGHSVIVYNRSVGPVDALVQMGATAAKTPAEAARSAEVVFAIVSNDEASRAIWLDEQTGAIHGLDNDTVAIASSTLTPEWSEELASIMQDRDVPFLEAPVVGTRPQAENGELVFLTGGAADTVERVRDVLDVLGGKVVHLGDAGEAMKMKLVINAMLGVQAALLGEMLAAIRRGMGKPDEVVDLLGALPVMSPLMTRLMGKMRPEAYSPNFPIDLVEKDLGYFVKSLSGNQHTHSLVEATRLVFQHASEAGYGQDDITGVRQLFED